MLSTYAQLSDQMIINFFKKNPKIIFCNKLNPTLLFVMLDYRVYKNMTMRTICPYVLKISGIDGRRSDNGVGGEKREEERENQIF